MAIKVQETVYHVIIDEGNPFSALPASMGMQKGDLITFKGEGNPVRLPVGGAGKFLVSDPATETGLKYANITDMAVSGTAELKNNTGAMIAAGTVVKGTTGSALDPYMYMIKATDHDAGQLYILSDDCATGETISCYYAPGSVIYILCDTEEVEIGDALAVSGTAGICTPLGTGMAATVGYALSAKASGSSGLVKCVLCDNPTIKAENISGSSLSIGTCLRAKFNEDGFSVDKAIEGSIPLGVQGNLSSADEAEVLVRHKDGDIAPVTANAEEIQPGDWLIPSSTDGQVRSGSGYGIGYAMTGKEAGASGDVTCLLKPGQYGKTTRYWYMSDDMEEDDVIAAWEFVGAASEEAALANVNHGESYPLSKILDTETWDTDTGFLIPATAGAGLTNTDILNMEEDVMTMLFEFSGISTSPTYVQAGGIALSKYKVLQIAPQGGANTGNSHAVNAFARNNNESNTTLYKGTLESEGMLTVKYNGSSSKTYFNGEPVSSTNSGESIGTLITNALGVIRQNSGTLSYRQAFYVKRVALYRRILSADMIAEIYNRCVPPTP